MQLELRGVSYKMNDRLLVVMLENKAQYEELILESALQGYLFNG